MGSQMKHPAGNFCWFELGTSDQNGAKEFYTQLFNWNFVDHPLPPEMGGTYTMWRVGDKEVGACYQLGPQMAGVPPHWMPYVAVENCDQAAAKITELGGTLVMPPFDVMEHGRMTAFKDPTGATLSVWQSREHTGADLVGAPNSFCWGELATTDAAAAKSFYTSLFGWTTKESTDGMPYTELDNAGQPIGGIMAMSGPQWEGIPPYWGIYFRVEDCDASAAKATELGGKLHVPPTDIPHVGRFAVVQDPQGAVFSIIKLNMPE
jgi:uncharacterized protein